MSMRHARLTLLAPVAGLALALAAPANAATNEFVTRTLTEPASPGLAVTGPLSDFVVTSKARIVVPTDWERRSAPGGRLRFRSTRSPGCRYDLTYSVKSVLAPSQNAVDYATARLPAPTAAHLLDSGQRGNRAFRVVRQQGTGTQVRVDALWAAVLTKRSDIAPGGQSAWTEVRVTAVSRKGDECHSGTWRQVLGPAIGDSLAVARTTLHFVEKE
jgi:hypothetical protein